MRQHFCRCGIGRALAPPGGWRALALASLGAAWLALAGAAAARNSDHLVPGRPKSGHTLSQLLFPFTGKEADVPEEPTATPPAVAPSATAQRQTSTTLLQQPGFIATEGELNIVPVQYDVTVSGGASSAVPPAKPQSAAAATTSQKKNEPASGLRSLWQTVLGTNPPQRPTTTASSNPNSLPAQYPLPNVGTVAPATAGVGDAAGSLLGQVAGVRPTTSPAAKPKEQQVARRLPAVSDSVAMMPRNEVTQASASIGAEVFDKPTGPDSPTRISGVGGTKAGAPYAVTPAPAAIYPPGSIPPPTALEQIPQALSNSTQTGGALSALWQPVTMTTNGPALPNPSERAAVANKQGSAEISDSPLAALTAQPFQLTNGNPATLIRGGPRNTGIAANENAPTVTEAIQGTSLFHQLSMAKDGTNYSPPEAVAESNGRSRLLRGTNLDGLRASSSSQILQTAATEEQGGAPRKDRELVALLQEMAPEPADLDAQTGDLVPEPAPDPAAGDAADADKNKNLETADKLGEAPQDRTLEFLRAETVLLKPGESQCDVGLAYTFTDNDFPILLTDGSGTIASVADVRFLVRELVVPLEYRVGLAKKVQGFLHVPVGWSNTQVNVANLEDFRNDGGLGDINFGLTMQCQDATANCPYIITTISGTAPTGGDPFTGIVGISPSAPSLGDGFWSVQGTVLFIQQYDPVVFFYGLGMQRSFEHEYVNIEFEPGAQYNYLLGVGFAVNERVTLSARFFGSYVEELEANGQRVPGTNTEPMTIRLSATISKPCQRFVEPFVEFGLNDDSVNSNIGITWTF